MYNIPVNGHNNNGSCSYLRKRQTYREKKMGKYRNSTNSPDYFRLFAKGSRLYSPTKRYSQGWDGSVILPLYRLWFASQHGHIH